MYVSPQGQKLPQNWSCVGSLHFGPHVEKGEQDGKDGIVSVVGFVAGSCKNRSSSKLCDGILRYFILDMIRPVLDYILILCLKKQF